MNFLRRMYLRWQERRLLNDLEWTMRAREMASARIRALMEEAAEVQRKRIEAETWERVT